jgi:hypothetical protein
MKVRLIGRCPVSAGMVVVLAILVARAAALLRGDGVEREHIRSLCGHGCVIFYWGAGTSHVADYPKSPLTFLYERNSAPG